MTPSPLPSTAALLSDLSLPAGAPSAALLSSFQTPFRPAFLIITERWPTRRVGLFPALLVLAMRDLNRSTVVSFFFFLKVLLLNFHQKRVINKMSNLVETFCHLRRSSNEAA